MGLDLVDLHRDLVVVQSGQGGDGFGVTIGLGRYGGPCKPRDLFLGVPSPDVSLVISPRLNLGTRIKGGRYYRKETPHHPP